MSGSVKAIDKTSVHRITSGQVIVDLCSAVKELVENALDAGATSVEVRLKEHGSELIEVADNGSGIDPVDYESIALKYHTSKISFFEDVAKVQSFGFRGEALSSLCAVSTVVFTTRTREQDAGMKLTFDGRGNLQSREVAARSPGTTASIKDLFKSLPVRAKAFKNNLKKEYVKLVHLLQAYAAICTGVRFIATNQIKKAARATIVSTQAKPGIKDNMAAVFGAKLASSLEPLAASDNTFSISGVISSAVKVGGKTNGHPQFLFLNSRPVDLPKAVRVINEAYRSLSSPALGGYKALFAINVEVASSMIDVNVTPDKRTVFVQQEVRLLDLLRSSLEDLWDPTKWQGAQSLANTSAPSQQSQPPITTKQQSLLNPVRSKKGSADSCNTAHSTPPVGPADSHRPRQDSADQVAAQSSCATATAAARTTPASGGTLCTPAPNTSMKSRLADVHSTAATLASSAAATASAGPELEQLVADKGGERDGHATDGDATDGHVPQTLPCSPARRSDASPGGSSNPLVLSSPEATPDAKGRAAAPEPPAASRARGALAAAMTGSGRGTKSSGSKNSSDFVRAASAAAAAAGGGGAAGTGSSAGGGAMPQGVSGSRLVLRSPHKPPTLLASGSVEVPASRGRADAERGGGVCVDSEGATTARASPGDDRQPEDDRPSASSGEDRAGAPEADTDAQLAPAAQHSSHRALECGSGVEQGKDNHNNRAVAENDAAASGVEAQVAAPQSSGGSGDGLGTVALHDRVHDDQEGAAVEPAGTGGGSHNVNVVINGDGDIEMLQDCSDDERAGSGGGHSDADMLQDFSDEDAAGSPKRSKRSILCLSDSPDVVLSKQQHKAARSLSAPAPHTDGHVDRDGGATDAAADAAAAGSGAVVFEKRDSAPAPAAGTAAPAEGARMHSRSSSHVPVPAVSRQHGGDVVELDKENEPVLAGERVDPDSKQSTNFADAAPHAAAIAQPSSEVGVDVDLTGPQPPQPTGERWRVEGGRVCARVDVGGMRARRLAADRKAAAASQAKSGCGLSSFKAASLQNRGTCGSVFQDPASQALRADGEGGTEQEAQAATELERRFNKKDFVGMTIHGQFNKGFIMASSGRELFIIDQHASDEKFNFERLQDTLVLNKQPLIVPVDLGLASVDDMTVRDNMDVFEQNGFGFVEDLQAGMLKLASVPFSKGTTFGPDDVHEMISMLHNGESTRIYVGDKRKSDVATKCRIRPSRVRAMLAMRACRGSIMVGTALSRQRMQTIVERLAGLDGPWNCPHGRPTLRHVHTLSIDA